MLCLNPGPTASSKPVSNLFRYVAFWQAMTFVMLLCGIWGLHAAGPAGEADSNWHLARTIYLSVCIGLVGFIIVAHTYVLQRRILQGLVISCSYCSRVRLEGRNWETLESYLSRRGLVRFSHGICPDCLAENHPDVPTAEDLVVESAAG